MYGYMQLFRGQWLACNSDCSSGMSMATDLSTGTRCFQKNTKLKDIRAAQVALKNGVFVSLAVCHRFLVRARTFERKAIDI